MLTEQGPRSPKADDKYDLIVVSDVRKTFEPDRGEIVTALEGVSLGIREDEVCAFLGPSGCGKSTLLRMIAGLEFPDSGHLSIDGEDIVGPGRDRGMIFQDYTSFPWLTVRQNVEYGMRVNKFEPHAMSEKAERFLRLVHLEGFADAWPSQLSGGMRQRVAIARTLANSPRVLLMDEPFGALDSETRWHMQELLLEIRREHRFAVALVTHDIEEAIFLADRIVFLSPRPGRVKEIISLDFKRDVSIGRKEELLDHAEFRRIGRHIMKNMRVEAQ